MLTRILSDIRRRVDPSQFSWYYVCMFCNKRKGTDLTSIDPENSQIVVIDNPRQDRWSDHFHLRYGEILPLTATGRATVRLLQLNRSERIYERNLLVEVGEIKLPG